MVNQLPESAVAQSLLELLAAGNRRSFILPQPMVQSSHDLGASVRATSNHVGKHYGGSNEAAEDRPHSTTRFIKITCMANDKTAGAFTSRTRRNTAVVGDCLVESSTAISRKHFRGAHGYWRLLRDN
jgi:hypothetical protein